MLEGTSFHTPEREGSAQPRRQPTKGAEPPLRDLLTNVELVHDMVASPGEAVNCS